MFSKAWVKSWHVEGYKPIKATDGVEAGGRTRRGQAAHPLTATLESFKGDFGFLGGGF